eukprot:5489999-Prorocentrum_lima.AAC.1
MPFYELLSESIRPYLRGTQRMLNGHERFRHQAELALMASRRGEQQALINCERNEQFMFGEYQQSL